MINYQRRCLFSFSPQTEEAAVVIHRYPYAHIRSYQHNSEAIRRPYLSFSLVCVMACSGLYESGTTQRTGKHSLNWGRRCGDISPGNKLKASHSCSFRRKTDHSYAKFSNSWRNKILRIQLAVVEIHGVAIGNS